ncbi:MAG: YciI family protein [Dehalococcoidales bacterium]|jgi:hypothetical protein
MAKYLLTYYGGKMETDPKKAEQSMAKWMKWFKDLGKAVVDSGNPTQAGKIVSSSGTKSVGPKSVTGYSIIQADSLDAALAMAKSCPQIAAGGEIEVDTIMPMM